MSRSLIRYVTACGTLRGTHSGTPERPILAGKEAVMLDQGGLDWVHV